MGSILQPLIDAVAHDEDQLRMVVSDWMTACWVREFEPEEALDLVTEVVKSYPDTFNGIFTAEMMTRTLWRSKNLYNTRDKVEAASVLMDMMLNVDPRYLEFVRRLNGPLADGEA